MLNGYGQFTESEYDAHLEGFNISDAPLGTSEHHFYFTYDCSFMGAAMYSSVTKLGTTIDIRTEYFAGLHPVTNEQIWLRYKKFGKSWNMFPNYVCKSILFPTKPKVGIRIVVTINNNDVGPIDFGMNLFNFADIEVVNPSLGQEGKDW